MEFQKSESIVLVGNEIYEKLKIISGLLTSSTKPNYKYYRIAFDERFDRASTIKPHEKKMFDTKAYHQINIRPDTFVENGRECYGFEITGFITVIGKAKLDANEDRIQEIENRSEIRRIEREKKLQDNVRPLKPQFKKADLRLRFLDNDPEIF